MSDDDLIERAARAGFATWNSDIGADDWREASEDERDSYRRFASAVLAEAAAQPPAPITAEDVRSAERAWLGNGVARDPHVSKAKAAFVADYLNRRGE